jgi:hypothetical protein
MRAGGRFLLFLGVLVGFLLLGYVFGDPLVILPRAEGVLRVVSEETVVENGRTLRWMTLDAGRAGSTRFILSTPNPLPTDSPLPLLIVLGGLAEAEENLQYLPPMGNNAVLVFQWPFPAYYPHEAWTDLRRIPHALWRTLQTPGQIAAATAWTLQTSPQIDPQQVSLLSLSLGVLPAPAAQHLMQAQNIPVQATVFAYGGAPIGTLLASHPEFDLPWLRPGAAALVNLLTRPLDPQRHLPALRGHFLVLYGTQDPYVPLRAAARFEALTPEPKTVVILDTPHLDVDEVHLPVLQQVMVQVATWLQAQEAMNPIDTTEMSYLNRKRAARSGRSDTAGEGATKSTSPSVRFTPKTSSSTREIGAITAPHSWQVESTA